MSRDKFAVILLLTAILSGLFWGSKMLGQPLQGGGNETLYNAMANSILERSSFVTDERDNSGTSEPFYPIFISGIYIFFGKDNFDAVRIIQILLFAFTVLIIYLLAKDFMSKKPAKIVGLLTALFYPLTASASVLTREILFAFLLVFLIYLLCRAQQSLKIKWFILSGVVLGLATLTNAIVQFFIIFVILSLLLIFRKDFFRKDILIKTGVFVLFFILVIGIWSFRDFKEGPKALNLKAGGVLGRKAEMMENVRGEDYLRHLGGQILGYYFFEKEDFNESLLLGTPETTKKFWGMMAKGESMEQVNEKISGESLRVIIRNLPQYFAISFLDFLQFNGPMLPNPEHLQPAPMQNLFIKNSHSQMPAIIKIIILLGLRVVYWLFFGFMIYGLIRATKDRKKSVCTGGFIWLILIVFYFNAVHGTTFGIPRYSIPIYPFYIVLFVYGVNVFLSKKLSFPQTCSTKKYLK